LILFSVTCIVGAVAWTSRIYYASFNLAIKDIGNFGTDFLVYYEAARAFVSGGDMYHPGPTLIILGNQLPYLYPPPAIFFFVPFTFVSFEQARIIVAAVYVLAVLLSVFLIAKILRHYDVRVSRLALLLICVSLFLFDPIVTTLVPLQVNLLILFLTTLFYYLLFVRKRSVASGVVLGLASIIKVWPVILLLLAFLYKSSRKFVLGLVLGTIATMATLSSISLWLQGLAVFQEFFTIFQTFEGSRPVTKAGVLAPSIWDNNISISQMVMKVVVLLNLNVQAALLILDVLKVVFVVGVVLYLYKISAIKKDASKMKEWEILSFSALLVLPLVVSNLVWIHYPTFLVLPFILIVFTIPLTRSEKAVLWVSLALFATRPAISLLFFTIGGVSKIVVNVFLPSTIALVLFTLLLLYLLGERTKRGYWNTPA
jgi:Glycosyltransferase family 87